MANLLEIVIKASAHEGRAGTPGRVSDLGIFGGLMAGSLAGKAALITGASQGMGRSIARRFAENGASRIILHYRGAREEAETAAREVEAKGSTAHSIQADLSQRNDVVRLFHEADKYLQGETLDILIVSASAPMVWKPLEKITEEEFDFTMAINARSSFLLLKWAIPRLADHGRIIGFSSPYVERAEAERGIVAAGKSALQSMILAAAKELGSRKITANVIMPGATATESFRKQVPEQYHEQIAAQTPLGRLGTPEDIADVVTFLCSDAGRWITAQVLKVNGGMI